MSSRGTSLLHQPIGMFYVRRLTRLCSQLVTFGIILGVWGFVVLMGLAFLLWDLWHSRRQKQPETVVHDKSETDATATAPPVRPSWWRRFSTNRTLISAATPAKDLEKGKEQTNDKLAPEPTRTDEETTTAARTPSPMADQETAAIHETHHVEETH